MARKQQINIRRATAEEIHVSITQSTRERIKLHHISNKESNDVCHKRTHPTYPSVSLVHVATQRKVSRYPLDLIPTMLTGFHLECERFRLLSDSDVRLPCKPSLVRPVLSASFHTPAVFGCGKDLLSLSRPAITLSAALAFVALPTVNPLDCLGVSAATKAMLSRTPSSSFLFESLYWASASSSL